MRQLALGVTGFAMFLNGFIGLKYYYVGCDAYGYCLEGALSIRIVSLFVTALSFLGVGLNWKYATRSKQGGSDSNFQELP